MPGFFAIFGDFGFAAAVFRAGVFRAGVFFVASVDGAVSVFAVGLRLAAGFLRGFGFGESAGLASLSTALALFGEDSAGFSVESPDASFETERFASVSGVMKRS